MARIEKTVFICYRRDDLPWALAVYKDLTYHGYDVFFDFMNINSGTFEDIIIGNIKARAHFLIILTPSTLERCAIPGDWVKREIENAIVNKRNIVPLMFENFDFNDSSVTKSLTGNLAILNRYNGLRMPSEYFDAGMDRLRERFLNTPLEAVLHPLIGEIENATKEQQDAAQIEISKLVSTPLIHKDANAIPLQQSSQKPDRVKERLTAGIKTRNDHTFSVETPLGKAFITIIENDKDQPFEVFINTAKAGSETAAVSEALGRLITLILLAPKSDEPRDRLREVATKLVGIGGGRFIGLGPNRVRSLADGIGQVFDEYLKGKSADDSDRKSSNGPDES
jgi:TIR domain